MAMKKYDNKLATTYQEKKVETVEAEYTVKSPCIIRENGVKVCTYRT